MNRLAWFAMLVMLPVGAQDKKPAPPAPKPPVVKPVQPPPKSSPVENEDIDKRRERMKQRDSEIDRMLKQKQQQKQTAPAPTK